MLAMPGMRAFSLSTEQRAGRVSCNQHGIFIGHVPLLKQAHGSWAVRPIAELNSELTFWYRLPIDIGSKASALALVASALNRHDLAMAAIATVQMQIPDPPLLASSKPENSDDITRRAQELVRSGLLKFWDPAKHPRTGMPPNPGWFAPVGSEAETNWVTPVAMQGQPEDKKLELLDGTGSEDQSSSKPDGPDPELRHEPLRPPPPGGLPKSSPTGQSQPTLPFPGGYPTQFAPYSGGKTYGHFQSGSISVELQSGYDGPAAAMRGNSGFDRLTLSHVEGHAAALMWQLGISDGTLYLSNTEICENCELLLNRMLPPGATLKIVLPDGSVRIFRGRNP